MQPLQQRGVPIPEREASSQATTTPDWESVRVFLEVVRRGSFRSASDQLGQSINALRRRIADLEQQLGVTLLTRHVDGVRTTAEGEEILAAARNEDLKQDAYRQQTQISQSVVDPRWALPFFPATAFQPGSDRR